MKLLKYYFIIFIALLLPGFLFAKVRQTPQPHASKLSTNISFRGLNLNGKVLKSSEALFVIENEKLIVDLIGPRKNFKDKIKRSMR